MTSTAERRTDRMIDSVAHVFGWFSAGQELFATLSEAGLIDTYRLLVIPVALGRGKALFGALTGPLRWRLAGTRTFDAGSVLLEYVLA